ncbi:putative MFS transporter [Bacillus sp. TS-2]|nr:putative MFS transporter [Bacillus sp. TS-2]
MVSKGKIHLSIAWVTLFLMGMDLFVVSPLLPFISEAYHISSAKAGWMVTVFAFTYAAFAPLFGWLSDRKDRSAFITCGLFLFVMSNLLMAFAFLEGFWLVERTCI